VVFVVILTKELLLQFGVFGIENENNSMMLTKAPAAFIMNATNQKSKHDLTLGGYS